MSAGIWRAEPNGSGDYQIVRRDRNSFAFEVAGDLSILRHALKAADRLNGWADEDRSWREYYGVRIAPPYKGFRFGEVCGRVFACRDAEHVSLSNGQAIRGGGTEGNLAELRRMIDERENEK